MEKEKLANMKPSTMEKNNAVIRAKVRDIRRHEADCGSSEVQIVIANEKIKYLTTHLLANRHDFASKRGLQAIVNRRRLLMDYLYYTDLPRLRALVEKLGIKYTLPAAERRGDKTFRYRVFKNTKQKQKQKRAGGGSGGGSTR